MISKEILLNLLPVNTKHIVCLADDRLKEFEGYKAVYKYQNIENIISELFALVDDNQYSYVIPGGDTKTQIISIFSPIGGSGKTSVCAALSKKLCGLSKKVLYLNLESISSTDYFFNGESEKNFSVLLYAALKGQNIPSKIECCRVVDTLSGAFFFKPHENALELLELRAEDYISLIDSLREIRIYDYVIIDMPSFITTQFLTILNKSDIVMLPFLEDSLSELRLSLFFKQIQVQGYGEFLGKLLCILNKSSGLTAPDWVNNVLNNKKICLLPLLLEKKPTELVSLLSQYIDVLLMNEVH